MKQAYDQMNEKCDRAIVDEALASVAVKAFHSTAHSSSIEEGIEGMMKRAMIKRPSKGWRKHVRKQKAQSR